MPKMSTGGANGPRQVPTYQVPKEGHRVGLRVLTQCRGWLEQHPLNYPYRMSPEMQEPGRLGAPLPRCLAIMLHARDDAEMDGTATVAAVFDPDTLESLRSGCDAAGRELAVGQTYKPKRPEMPTIKVPRPPWGFGDFF